MPRDSNGNYVLPAGNPVQPLTIIESTWANGTMDDIAQALTQSLSRSGQGAMLVPFLNADGDAGNPGISWVNEPTSGFFRKGVGEMALSIITSEVFVMNVNGLALGPNKRITAQDGALGNQLVNYNDAVQIAIDQIGSGGGLFLPFTGGTLTGNLVISNASLTVVGTTDTRALIISDTAGELRSRFSAEANGHTYLDLFDDVTFPNATLYIRKNSDFATLLTISPVGVVSYQPLYLEITTPTDPREATRKDYVDTQALWQGRASFVSSAAPTTEGVDGDIWFQI